MTQKTFFAIAAIVFLAVAVLHAARLVYGWSAVIGDFEVPMWFSWCGLFAAGALAYFAVKFARQ